MKTTQTLLYYSLTKCIIFTVNTLGMRHTKPMMTWVAFVFLVNTETREGLEKHVPPEQNVDGILLMGTYMVNRLNKGT